MEKENKDTILYDGSCRLCSGLMGKIAASAKSGAFELHDASKETVPGIDHESAMREMHVIGSDGKIYKNAEAILRIMERYPLLRPLAFIGKLPFIRPLLPPLYRLISKNRHLL